MLELYIHWQAAIRANLSFLLPYAARAMNDYLSGVMMQVL
jgi:hypothetical protein